MVNGFWRANEIFDQVTPEHAFFLAKHMVGNGLGPDAFRIHKKVPYHRQDMRWNR